MVATPCCSECDWEASLRIGTDLECVWMPIPSMCKTSLKQRNEWRPDHVLDRQARYNARRVIDGKTAKLGSAKSLFRASGDGTHSLYRGLGETQ